MRTKTNVTKRLFAMLMCVAMILTTIDLSAFTTEVKAASAGYSLLFYYGSANSSVTGGSVSELSTILGKLGIDGAITEATSSNTEYFYATEEDGVWYVYSESVFGNTEALTVTVDEAEYKIWATCLPDSLTVVLEDTLYFDPNGGSGSMEGLKGPDKNGYLTRSIRIGDGRAYILPECGFTAPANMEFAGWEIDGEQYEAGYPYVFGLSSSLMIKAVWKEIEEVPDEEIKNFEYLVIGQETYYDNAVIYVEDEEFPDGEYITVPYTDIRVETLEGEDVVSAYKSEYDTGWEILAENVGHVRVYMYYDWYDGTPVDIPDIIDITVVTELYDGWLNLENERIRLGESVDFSAFLIGRFYNSEEGNLFDIAIEESGEYYVEYSIVEDTDDGKLKIIPDEANSFLAKLVSTGDENDGSHDYLIEARFYKINESGESQEVAWSNTWFYTVTDYYEMEVEGEHNPYLYPGKSEILGVDLYKYEVGKEPEKITEIEIDGEIYPIAIECHYEEDFFDVSVDENNYITITKKRNAGTNIGISVGYYIDDSFVELANQYIYTEYIHFNVGFEDLKVGYWTWNYIGSDINYALNTDSLEGLDPEKLSIAYQYGYIFDDNDDEFVELDLDLDEYFTFDGINIPANVATVIRDEILAATGGSGDMLEVKCTIYYDGNELWQEDLNIQFRDTIYDYIYPGIRNGELLVGWEDYINSSFDCYVKNSEHPDGEWITIKIDRIDVLNNQDEAAITYERDDDYGWLFGANNVGSATVTLHYTPIEGSENTGEYSFDVLVKDTVTEVKIDNSNHYNWAIMDTTEMYKVYVTRYLSGDSVVHYPGNLENSIRIEWGILDGEDYVTNYWTDEENNNFYVQFGHDEDNYDVIIFARVIDILEDGSECECAYEEFTVSVCYSNYDILPFDLGIVNLEVGESVTVVPGLWYFQFDCEPELVTEIEDEEVVLPVGLTWNYDENYLEIIDNGDGSYTITRLFVGEIHLDIIMGPVDEENSELIEFAKRSYYLEEKDYEIIFGDKRDFFVNEDVIISINTDNLQNYNQDKLSYNITYGWLNEVDCIEPIDINLDEYININGINIPSNILPAIRKEILEKSDYATHVLNVKIDAVYDGKLISSSFIGILLMGHDNEDESHYFEPVDDGTTHKCSMCGFVEKHDFTENCICVCGYGKHILEGNICTVCGKKIKNGLTYFEGSWQYFVDDEVDFNMTDIVYFKDAWYYIQDGVLNKEYAGLVNHAGKLWYVSNGKLDKTFVGFVEYVDNTYFVKNGTVDTTATGFKYANEKWAKLVNGVVDDTYTGLYYYNNDWWYLTNGFLDKTFKGVTEKNGSLWFVRNGKLSRENGITKYDGNIYWITNGAVDTSATKLFYYADDATWYYCRMGVVDWTYNTLAWANDKWWYINNGVLDKSYTGLVLFRNQLWYVTEGLLDKTYVGTYEYQGKTYKVANGIGTIIE